MEQSRAQLYRHAGKVFGHKSEERLLWEKSLLQQTNLLAAERLQADGGVAFGSEQRTPRGRLLTAERLQADGGVAFGSEQAALRGALEVAFLDQKRFVDL